MYAKLGSGGKAATRAEIAAATQLFTEPYMVQWLLQLIKSDVSRLECLPECAELLTLGELVLIESLGI